MSASKMDLQQTQRHGAGDRGLPSGPSGASAMAANGATEDNDEITNYIERRRHYQNQFKRKKEIETAIQRLEKKKNWFRRSQILSRVGIALLVIGVLIAAIKIYAIIYYLKMHSVWFAELMFKMGY